MSFSSSREKNVKIHDTKNEKKNDVPFFPLYIVPFLYPLRPDWRNLAPNTFYFLGVASYFQPQQMPYLRNANIVENYQELNNVLKKDKNCFVVSYIIVVLCTVI